MQFSKLRTTKLEGQIRSFVSLQKTTSYPNCQRSLSGSMPTIVSLNWRLLKAFSRSTLSSFFQFKCLALVFEILHKTTLQALNSFQLEPNPVCLVRIHQSSWLITTNCFELKFFEAFIYSDGSHVVWPILEHQRNSEYDKHLSPNQVTSNFSD